jgi:hypothetical protein
VADESKEEEDGNNPCLSPNRCDEEEEEEEEEQVTPKTSKVEVDPDAADVPKTSTEDDDPGAAHASVVRGRKDRLKIMRLFHKGKDPASFLSREEVNEEVPPLSSFISRYEEMNNDVPPAAFMPIAPVKVPCFAKRPKKRQADEINGDRKAKKARKLLQNPSDDKGRMDLVYLDADGNGKVFIPITAGNLLGRTPVPSQPGRIDIGIGDVLCGEGITKGLIKVNIVHPITRIEVSLLHDSEIVLYSRHHTDGISATTKLTKSNPHIRLLAGDSIFFNNF